MVLQRPLISISPIPPTNYLLSPEWRWEGEEQLKMQILGHIFTPYTLPRYLRHCRTLSFSTSRTKSAWRHAGNKSMFYQFLFIFFNFNSAIVCRYKRKTMSLGKQGEEDCSFSCWGWKFGYWQWHPQNEVIFSLRDYFAFPGFNSVICRVIFFFFLVLQWRILGRIVIYFF